MKNYTKLPESEKDYAYLVHVAHKRGYPLELCYRRKSIDGIKAKGNKYIGIMESYEGYLSIGRESTYFLGKELSFEEFITMFVPKPSPAVQKAYNEASTEVKEELEKEFYFEPQIDLDKPNTVIVCIRNNPNRIYKLTWVGEIGYAWVNLTGTFWLNGSFLEKEIAIDKVRGQKLGELKQLTYTQYADLIKEIFA